MSMRDNEKEIEELINIIISSGYNGRPKSLAKYLIERGFTRKPIAEQKYRKCLQCGCALGNDWLPSFCANCRSNEEVDRKWPEKIDCDCKFTKCNNQCWNACHDEFMRVINKTPVKRKEIK